MTTPMFWRRLAVSSLALAVLAPAGAAAAAGDRAAPGAAPGASGQRTGPRTPVAAGSRRPLAAGRQAATAEAKALNLQASDLPKHEPWAGSPQPGNTKATEAAGVRSAACLRKIGAASLDAFGTSHTVRGNVLADVLSPQFAPKGGVGLPAANSEVVIVAKAKVAATDLAAVAKKGALACLAAQYLVNTEASGSGKAHVTASFEKLPRHGGGNGGVGIRLLEKGGKLPLPLYNDEYFYVQGNAEIVFSFLDLGSPFNKSWAVSTVASAMARAAKRVH